MHRMAKLTERGMLRPSFVPPPEIRRLREFTRLRADLVHERTRHWARLEKLLERALIKISAVASSRDTDSTPGDGVAPQAPGRVPGAADAVPVGLARADPGYEGVPDVGVVIGHRDLGFDAGRIEQAQGDTAGDAGGEREVGARQAQVLAGRGAERERLAGSATAGRPSGADRAAGTAPAAVVWLLVIAAPFLLGRAGRRRARGPRRAGAGSHRRSGRSSRSGGRRRSRRRCRRGSTR